MAHAYTRPLLYPPQPGDSAYLGFVKKHQLSLLVGTVEAYWPKSLWWGQREGLPTLGLPTDKDPSLLCLLTDSD